MKKDNYEIWSVFQASCRPDRCVFENPSESICKAWVSKQPDPTQFRVVKADNIINRNGWLMFK